jgi:hypothetical protein
MIDPRFEAQLSPSLLTVTTPEGGEGTGFVVPGGAIATSAVLVKASAEVTLHFTHPEQVVVAKVERLELGSGLALVRPLLPVSRNPLVLSDHLEPNLGQRVLIISSPLRIAHGFVASHPANGGCFSLDATLEAQHLGAPVLDETGRVVGVHTQGGGVSAEVASVRALQQLLNQANGVGLICDHCGGPFGRDDAQCPGCGVVTPLHQGETFVERPELARAARLVSSLLTRLGHDPIQCRLDFRRWRTGKVEWALAADGQSLGFTVVVGPAPSHRPEGLYRFLLTYGDETARHAAVGIDAQQRVVLNFREPLSWLGEKTIEARLLALSEDAAQLESLLNQAFRIPPPPRADDDLELPS